MWWQRLGDLLRFRLPQSDLAFVQSYLNEAGLFLFNQMSVVDQKHSVRVARYIIQEAVERRGINLNCVIQAALLHDAGKVKGDIKRYNRVCVGIIRRLCPCKRHKWSSRDKQSALRYSLYVDMIHPTRGAYMAESMGIDSRVVSLIKNHHEQKPEVVAGDGELSLLQLADAKN